MSEPTVLDYARFHGLATDHTAEDVLHQLHHLSATAVQVPEEEENLSELNFPDIDINLQEPKLQLSRAAGMLLADCTRNPRTVIQWNALLPDPYRLRKLRLEEPLLEYDHEVDVAAFRKDVACGLHVENMVGNCSEMLFESDDHFDEEWNDIQSGRFLKEVEEELNAERVLTTKEAILHLSEI